MLGAQIVAATQASSGETGLATFTDLGGGITQVALTTSGGTDTGPQPAVIANGACGSATTVFALLNNVLGGPLGGQSITKVNYPLSSLTGKGYSLNVFNSSNVNTIQACGNLP
jgi:hypothetical protein